MNNEEFGVRLRVERKRLGLTQSQFGTLGGVALSTQHYYESGSHYPDVRYITKIASAGVDIHYVLLGSRSNPGEMTDEEIIALREICNVVREWAVKRRKMVPDSVQAHLIRTFFEQYLATRQIKHETYEQTLGLVG